MAAVEVTISGVLYDKLARTTRPVVLIGEASLTGLEIGGGPMPGGPGGKPPGIWGPTDPRPGWGLPGGPPPTVGGGPVYPPEISGPGGPWPTPPINLPPVEPGRPPVSIWPGRPNNDLPPAPPDVDDDGNKPPPPEGGWGYSAEYGWGYFPGPTEASPKGRR